MTRRVPTATYRVQLHRKWGFDAVRSIIPYLMNLGASDLYMSPILKARTGSAHGYDVVDPTQVNPELGGKEGFSQVARDAKAHGMGILLDIVPNHMAISPENVALMDVLAHGRASACADWFDIAWPKDAASAVITLPVLARTLEDAIDNAEIALELSDGAFVVRYFDWAFPVEPGSTALILERAAENEGDGGPFAHLLMLATNMPDWRSVGGDKRAARYRQTGVLQEALSAAIDEYPMRVRMIEDAIRATPLAELLDMQPYRLCYWQEAMNTSAYRRFFDITDLIGVRVEDSKVLDATHKRILDLVRSGNVTGLRIDHIDGLADPARYLDQLQAACGGTEPDRYYILVEKILLGDETLEERWPVAGTTGYDFANALNGVFVDRTGLEYLTTYYYSLCGHEAAFVQMAREQKRRAARALFGGEVKALADSLSSIARDLRIPLPTQDQVAAAIVEVSACLRVYRTYITREDVRQRIVSARDRALISEAVALARRFADCGCAPAIDCLERVLLLNIPDDVSNQVTEGVADFIVKWQQFTGPLAAKGVEDTALYRDARLASLNEVGADAANIEQPGGVAGFHKHNACIASNWPRTMTATSTHDTKRGEDARARIHVLSEIADEWVAAAARWRSLNAAHRSMARGDETPDAITELFLYQNMLGAWPLDELQENVITERIVNYAIKAAREAKAHTNWIDPQGDYEDALKRFVQQILDRNRSGPFLADFKRLLNRIAFPGALNSVSATMLKIASPGVPDFYQGTELWDFSLVDPDNRRPVDFKLRQRHLEQLMSLPEEPPAGALGELLNSWRDGRMKMFITHRGLQLRHSLRDVFLQGDYLPIESSGPQKEHICAFARRLGRQWVVAIAPIRTVELLANAQGPLGEAVWTDTTIELPPGAPERLVDAITGRALAAPKARLRIAEALRLMPVALLHS